MKFMFPKVYSLDFILLAILPFCSNGESEDTAVDVPAIDSSAIPVIIDPDPFPGTSSDTMLTPSLVQPAPIPKGAVLISLTDFPLGNGDVTRVLIHIDRIEIYSEKLAAWMEVIKFENGKVFDLMRLQNGQLAELGAFQLETGTYDQIRLYLNDGNEIEVMENSQLVKYPLKVPSGTQTGIKLVRSFQVSTLGVTNIVLDFIANESVAWNNGQGYRLKPTIKIKEVKTTDGITKFIRSAEGGGTGYL